MIDRNKRYRITRNYEEKIGYWNYKLNKAIDNLDSEGIKYAAERLAYFVLRQNQLDEIRNNRLEQLY